jgi:hypothetical protein
MKLGPCHTDATKTIEQFTGSDWGDPEEAPTGMIKTIIRAAKKPLATLSDEDIWFLISQGLGQPFILDLVLPILERDPLHCFLHYEGDVLARLLCAGEDVWTARPEYRAALDDLKQRALAGPDYTNDMFRKVLKANH